MAPRLEQAVGEAEGENVLRRLLAEKMVDTENLIFAEDLVQFGVERYGAFNVDAEGFLHDHVRALDEISLRQKPHGRERGVGGNAEIMDAAAFAAKRRLRALDRGFQHARPCGERRIVENLREFSPMRLLDFAHRELVDRAARDGPKTVGVDIVERDADDAATRNEARSRQMKQARQQLAPRQIAGRADQDDHLRKFRADAGHDLRQFILPILRRGAYRAST